MFLDPHRSSIKVGVLISAVALFATACGSTQPSRTEALSELATTSIIPTFEQLASKTSELEDATTALCQELSEATLGDAQEALSEARTTWSRSEAMWVGPLTERRSWAVIDLPINIEGIEELIADTELPLDNQRLSQRIAANQRGLGAVEYVLDSTADQSTVLEALATGQRCEYLTGISSVIAQEAALIPDDWTVGFEDAGPWINTFTASDSDGLDVIVNDSLFLIEAIADGELGTALGQMDREQTLEPIVEGPLGLGVSDIQAHLRGLRSVLVGDPTSETSLGLSPLFTSELGERLNSAFDDAEAAAAAIDGPLVEAIEQRSEDVSMARDRIKGIQLLLSTEVVAQLGVTIGFSDADGDTG